AHLSDDGTWFLPRAPTPAPGRYRLVHGFVSGLGATPVAIDPQAHDQLVAVTSHLPHALANLLVNQAGAARIEGHEPLAAAGGAPRGINPGGRGDPPGLVGNFLGDTRDPPRAPAPHPPPPP